MEAPVQTQAQEGGRVSIASLDKEIAQSRAEFTRLNAEHWFRVPGAQHLAYRQISAASERSIVTLADRIARLRRFRSELFARNYALDGTRGIEFS
jgi:hypothetical protein